MSAEAAQSAWQNARPALEPAEDAALDVWNFCGGWYPERLPWALALYPADDAEALLVRLMAIRDALASSAT
jgi:hypothetical protein